MLTTKEITELFYESGIYEGVEEILKQEPYCLLTEDELRIFFAITVENILELINTDLYVEDKNNLIIENNMIKVVPEPRNIPNVSEYSTVSVGE